MDIKNSQKIGLIIKPNDERSIKVTQDLVSYLLSRKKKVFIDEEARVDLLERSVESVHRKELATLCNLIVALGGDGTLLCAARAIAHREVPLIGISLGNLGFLVEISPQQMVSKLDQIFDNHYRLEERTMLAATHLRGNNTLEEYNACNDVVIKHHGTARMIELNTSIDDSLISSILSDGLIVSTPTGSTAYALSSGGPLVEPILEATLIVPICPHTLSYRPLIIDANKTIEIEYTHYNEDPGLISIDGQINTMSQPGDRVTIKTLPHKLNLIQPPKHDYFHTLRTKLRWSEKL